MGGEGKSRTKLAAEKHRKVRNLPSRAPRKLADPEVPPPPTARHRGSQMWSTKLTEDDIRLIRKMHAAGWNISQLAAKYKTEWLTMSRIVKRQSWTHVE